MLMSKEKRKSGSNDSQKLNSQNFNEWDKTTENASGTAAFVLFNIKLFLLDCTLDIFIFLQALHLYCCISKSAMLGNVIWKIK